MSTARGSTVACSDRSEASQNVAAACRSALSLLTQAAFSRRDLLLGTYERALVQRDCLVGCGAWVRRNGIEVDCLMGRLRYGESWARS